MSIDSVVNPKRTLHVGRARIVGCVAALLLSTFMLPAQARGATSAVCSIVSSLDLAPGLSLTEGSGTYGTGGHETGSMTCVGTFDGHAVTGPGFFGFEATYVGTCLADHGSGRYTFTVPTDAGTMHVAGTYTESSIGPLGQIEGSQPGASVTGNFVFYPTQGDCAVSPVTRAQAYIAVSISG
jgi:hypothetical protein